MGGDESPNPAERVQDPAEPKRVERNVETTEVKEEKTVPQPQHTETTHEVRTETVTESGTDSDS